ncbi:MAG: twin-arginine translocation signal domain-containing protein, partial [Fuerstiella sp.]
MINRRNVLKGAAAGIGVALGSTIAPNMLQAAPAYRSAPKRVIFFLQNQGFDPATCVPKGLKETCELDGVTLPEP